MLNLIAVPAISLQSIVAKDEFLSYESKDFGFSIQYPSDWTKEEESTSKSSNVNIVVSFVKQNGSQLKTEADLYIRTAEFLGKNITLEKFAQLEKAYTSSLLAVSSFNESETVIGNKSALQIEYDFKGFGGTVRHGINSLIINDDIGYSLVFTVDKEKYDKYLPIAQKMANSFEILR
jgi:eukaryotic-like serine/threonine-protein kinase